MTAAVSEIDFHVEARLVSLIRRRFLWLCGVEMAFGLVTAILFFAGFRRGGWRGWGISLFDLALIAAAAVYAWRASPNRRRLMGVIFLLVVLSEGIELAGVRISSQSVRSFLLSALPSAAWNYLFAAFFIRWSVREALMVAGSMLVITLLIAATFLARPVGVSLILPLSPLWFLPGLLICWLAHSRLRTRFRLQFESMQYRQFKSELTSARKLHESLLPRQVTEGPVHLSYVYEPMREIGGDLIYLHKDTRPDIASSSFIVLDVTGHGIAAALTVNRLVGEIERLFGEDAAISPGQLIRALDRYISLTLARHGIFATAFCARVSCESNSLEWYCGGHPPAFICRKDGSLERLESTGPLLGVDDDSPESEDPHTRFDRGDVLLCYTDGAVEAMNARREMVGIEGVEAMLAQCTARGLAPGEWPAFILKEVLEHRAAPAEDDTLIAAIHCPEADMQPASSAL